MLLFLCNLFANLSIDTIPDEDALNKNFALLFAVEEYDNNDSWENLPNTINATKEIAQELEKTYGFNTKIVENPTKDEFLKAINDYSKVNFGEYVQLLVFFSGHGTIKEKGKRKRIGFLTAKDSKSIENDEQFNSFIRHSTLSEELDALECRHIFVLLDACFSSTFGSDLNNAITRADPKKKYLPNKLSMQEFQKKELKYVSRLYLTSGNKETFAGSSIEYSPFTNTFLSALREDYLKKEGIILFDALKAYFKNARLVPEPKGGKFRGHQAGGNFLFVKKAKIPIIGEGEKPEQFILGNSILQTEEYKLRKEFSNIYKAYRKIAYEEQKKIMPLEGREDFYLNTTGSSKTPFDMVSHYTITNKYYRDFKCRNSYGLTYNSPYYSFKFNNEVFYEALNFHEIDWDLIQDYISINASKKIKSCLNK